MVNKAKLIETMADLVRDKKLEGISDLRDESDRDGMRIVIELKKGANANVLLNQLYKHTQMETTFGVNNLALVDNQPMTLNLKETIGILHQAQAGSRHKAQRVRAEEGTGPGTHPGGPADRAGEHRRFRQHTQEVGQRGRCKGRVHVEIRPVGRAVEGHSRHAAQGTDRPGAQEDRGRALRAAQD